MAARNEKLTPLQGGSGTRALATRVETDTVLRTGVKRWAAKLEKAGLMPPGKSLEGFQKWMKKSFEYKELVKEWEDRYGQLIQKGHGRGLEQGGPTAPGTTAPEPGSGRVPIQSSAGEDYIRNMGRSQLDERTLAELRKADIPTNQLEAFRNYLMGGKQTFETFSPEQLARYLHTFEDVDVIIAEAYNDSLERAVNPNVTIDAQEIERRLNNNTIREGVSHGGPVTVTKDPSVIDQRLKVAGSKSKIDPNSILDKPPPSTFSERYNPNPTVEVPNEELDLAKVGRNVDDEWNFLRRVGLADNKLINTLMKGGDEAIQAWRKVPAPVRAGIKAAPLTTLGVLFDHLEVQARQADHAEEPSLINKIDLGMAHTSQFLGGVSAAGFVPAELPQAIVSGAQMVSDELQRDRSQDVEHGMEYEADRRAEIYRKQQADKYYKAGGGNAAMVKHGWSIEQTQQQGRKNLNKQWLSTPERTD